MNLAWAGWRDGPAQAESADAAEAATLAPGSSRRRSAARPGAPWGGVNAEAESEASDESESACARPWGCVIKP